MKDKKGNVPVIALIVVIVAITVSVITWFVTMKLQTPAQQSEIPQSIIPAITKTQPETPIPVTQESTTNQSDEFQSTIDPQEIVKKIINNWEGKYTLLDLDENNHPKINELSIRLSEKGPAYKVDGFNFYVSYNGSSLGIMPHDPNPTDHSTPKAADILLRKEIANIYKDFGLLETETRGDKNNGTDIDIYMGKGLICSVQTPTSRTSANNAECGRIDVYEEMAKRVKPLADAIPNVEVTTIFYNLEITDSPVKGYQKASVGIQDMNGGGAVILLYKKDSSSWMYFTTVQEMLPCSAYNTIDIKNAFKGESCEGVGGQISRVQ